MCNTPIGYFLTWHTYASWLHGDKPGSVDREHNKFASPSIEPSERRRDFMRSEQSFPTVVLDTTQRQLVMDTVKETAGYRNWDLIALHIGTMHAHVVVGAHDRPEFMLNSLKAYATRRLRRAKLIEIDRPVWSRHGSTRYVWDDTGLAAIVRYVVLEQGTTLHPLPWVPDEWKSVLSR